MFQDNHQGLGHSAIEPGRQWPVWRCVRCRGRALPLHKIHLFLLLQISYKHHSEWLHKFTVSIHILIFQSNKKMAVYHPLIQSLR